MTEYVGHVLAAGGAPGLDDALGAAVLIGGILAWANGDREGAATLLERSRSMADDLGVVRRAAIAHAFLGHLARTAGRTESAWREHTTARDAFDVLGNPRGVAWSHHDLGLVALDQGRLRRAEGLLAEALAEFETEDDPWACAWAWSGLAEVAVRQEDWVWGAALLARALPVYLANADAPRIAHCRALQVEIDVASRPAELLTPRQREVAALVATGATNRQIARDLGISDKTVEVHLSQMMARLGVQSRAQVAAHAVRARLDVSSPS
ncbi:MAG: LuxR C-terminal-related transcriptional regulator [Nocardioides sp.]